MRSPNFSASTLVDPYTGERIIKAKAPIPIPHCCLCGREVDKVELRYEENDNVTIISHCHGDVDYQTFKESSLMTIPHLDLAFDTMSRFTDQGRQIRVFHKKKIEGIDGGDEDVYI